MVRGGESSRESGVADSRTPFGLRADLLAAELRLSQAGLPFRVPAGVQTVGEIRMEPPPWMAPPEALTRLYLLVVDEDTEVRNACAEIARQMGFVVLQAVDAGSAARTMRSQKVDLMLLDLRASRISLGSGGVSLLEEVKATSPQTTVVVMTASGAVANAVEAMRLGAEDCLTKPFALEELVKILDRAARRTLWNAESRALRERLRSQRGGGPLIGHSPEMEKLYRILSKVAHSTHPVLILGENGTGKELVARSIHFNGPHASKPFRAVDCGASNPLLLEAELFGYVKGAQPVRKPGASMGGEPKDGLLATLDGGTVFLDEVGELSLELQAKLLRALQERVVHPIGATHTVPIAGRVLAATNADIALMVEHGKFRRDLYFRLNVVSLRIPALRQRKEDIPELAQYFLEKSQRSTGMLHTLADEVMRVMMVYDWPGNVEELVSVLEHACAMASGPVVYLRDLPPQLQEVKERMMAEAQPEADERTGAHARSTERIQSIAEMEKQAILATIRQLRGDKLLAAKLLGIGKTTLYRKLKEYGIQEWAG
jgi:DNA-binding NtrC family response regulator